MQNRKRNRILRKTEVIKATGHSSSTIDRKEKAGQFPQRIKLGPNSVGWWDDEVYEHLESLNRGGCDAPEAAIKARSRGR